MDSITLKKKMDAAGIDLVNAETLEERVLCFERALRIVIPPRNQSDRTSFRNITGWLTENCKSENFDEYIIFRRVLDFALEASGPESRKPAAVFMSILKKEIGYKKS